MYSFPPQSSKLYCLNFQAAYLKILSSRIFIEFPILLALETLKYYNYRYDHYSNFKNMD